MISNAQAQATWLQTAPVLTYNGVMNANAENPCILAPLLCVIFTGIMIEQPIMLMNRKILRHILVNRRKTVASSPMQLTSCGSLVCSTGLNQAKKPRPTGGGVCLRSACLTLGA